MPKVSQKSLDKTRTTDKIRVHSNERIASLKLSKQKKHDRAMELRLKSQELEMSKIISASWFFVL